MYSDFFDNHDGSAGDHMATPWGARLRDMICDLHAFADLRRKRLWRAVEQVPPQKILIVGVRNPSRADALDRIVEDLAASRHHVSASLVTMQPKGKFENIHDAIAAAPEPLSAYDWLIITDDDVALPRRFTDRYIAAARLGRLVLSQPAHRYHSYATYQITRRKLGHLIRQTQFVEIGPLTVIHREAFETLLTFPQSRWAYGIDVLWADQCRAKGWRMGVVDALPIRHLRPVAATYDMNAAIEEGRTLLRRHAITLNRRTLFAPGQEIGA